MRQPEPLSICIVFRESGRGFGGGAVGLWLPRDLEDLVHNFDIERQRLFVDLHSAWFMQPLTPYPAVFAVVFITSCTVIGLWRYVLVGYYAGTNQFGVVVRHGVSIERFLYKQ
ncbi:hypothetical protein CC80DRAFT_494675 [Byssothecium circinans]|uniref:Uncharacterized protein n=1 Tax=Byssothecium circinans TaxID=147558 RepID=A0A6A5TRH1_9PLEO|nr:hypothetical protein CC80DRAFT_494675 [Byssothecium circinans]